MPIFIVNRTSEIIVFQRLLLLQTLDLYFIYLQLVDKQDNTTVYIKLLENIKYDHYK